MNNKSVFVTGGCGYIGSHVVRQLSEAGYKVTVYDNLSTGRKDALIHGETLVEADLADIDALDRVLTDGNFDSVLHFAASIVVPESVSEPLLYYRNNTVNTVNLLDACKKHGISNIVFSSTAAVYGESGTGEPITEKTPLAPTNPYARSKLMDEWILEDLAEANPEFSYVVLRYFNVAGADFQARMGQCSPEATHLIKVACEVALGVRKQLSVFGDDYDTHDGTCIRDYIHIEDLASAHLQALAYIEKGGKNQTFNCGYGNGFSVKEVIATVNEVHGSDIPCQVGPRRPGDVSSLVADSKQMQDQIGWEYEHSGLFKIVKSAYDWEKRLRNL